MDEKGGWSKLIVFAEDGSLGFGIEPLDHEQDRHCAVFRVKPGGQAQRLGVNEHWLIHEINGENVLQEHQNNVIKMMEEATRPLNIKFLHPRHKLHPHSHLHHHKHIKHTFTMTLEEDEKLWFIMKYVVDDDIEEAYLIITKITAGDSKRVDCGLRRGYALSGIGVNQAFNVAEEDLRNYIENDLRPMKLIFLTVSNNSASIAQFTLFSIILT